MPGRCHIFRNQIPFQPPDCRITGKKYSTFFLYLLPIQCPVSVKIQIFCLYLRILVCYNRTKAAVFFRRLPVVVPLGRLFTMAELHELSQDRRLRNHFNIDKRRRTSRHTQPDPHFHSYYEFYYLIDGACRFFVLDTMYTLSPGDLIICGPGEYHRNSYFGPKMHDRYTVYFDSVRITEDLKPFAHFLPTASGGHRQYHIPENLQHDFLMLQDLMLSQYQLDSPAGELSLLHLLPVYLIFLSQNAQPVLHEGKQINQTDLALQSASQYIAVHYSEPLTLDQVSRISGFSPTYFSRKFKDFAGLSFTNYLTHIRLRESAVLLRSTSMRISEISQKCGFTGANYFGDVFHLAYGVSPREYRRQEEDSLGKK